MSKIRLTAAILMIACAICLSACGGNSDSDAAPSQSVTERSPSQTQEASAESSVPAESVKSSDNSSAETDQKDESKENGISSGDSDDMYEQQSADNAGLPVSGNFVEAAADVDKSGKIEITDATHIQRWLAGIATPYPIGSPFDQPTEATVAPPTEQPTSAPTEAPTQKPTVPPTEASTSAPTQSPTDEEGWGHIVIRP